MNWGAVLRARWRLIRNSARGGRRGARGRVRPLLVLLLGLVLGGLVCLSFAGVFGGLAADGAPAAETAVALAWMLTATLVGLLIFDLQEAVSTLVADTDLELLRRAPISPRALFLIKFLDAFPRTSFLLLILAIPAVLAFHLFYPLPPWMWVLFPLQIVALWAIPLGLGSMAATLLLRWVPAKRARTALGLLSTFTLFGLWMMNSFLIPHLAGGRIDSIANVREILAADRRAHELSPGHWAASALAAAASGEGVESVRATALLVAVAALALIAAAWTASRHLEAIQMRIADPGRSRRGIRARAEGRARPVDSRHDRPRPLLTVTVRRDALLLLRDWTALGDVVTTAVLWTLLPLVGLPLFDVSAPTLARTMLLALTVGLGYEVASRAVPFEGRGGAWMKLAPVGAMRWVMSKWVGTAVISAPLLVLATLGIALSLRIPGPPLTEILFLVLPALALALAAGIWTGIAFGRTDWINPRAMLTLGGRITSTFLMLAQAGIWFAFAGVADLHRDLLPPGWAFWGPALLGALLILVPLGAAARRLERREWV